MAVVAAAEASSSTVASAPAVCSPVVVAVPASLGVVVALSALAVVPAGNDGLGLMQCDFVPLQV